ESPGGDVSGLLGALATACIRCAGAAARRRRNVTKRMITPPMNNGSRGPQGTPKSELPIRLPAAEPASMPIQPPQRRVGGAGSAVTGAGAGSGRFGRGRAGAECEREPRLPSVPPFAPGRSLAAVGLRSAGIMSVPTNTTPPPGPSESTSSSTPLGRHAQRIYELYKPHALLTSRAATDSRSSIPVVLLHVLALTRPPPHVRGALACPSPIRSEESPGHMPEYIIYL